jgi:hypothetical protein
LIALVRQPLYDRPLTPRVEVLSTATPSSQEQGSLVLCAAKGGFDDDRGR